MNVRERIARIHCQQVIDLVALVIESNEHDTRAHGFGEETDDDYGAYGV